MQIDGWWWDFLTDTESLSFYNYLTIVLLVAAVACLFVASRKPSASRFWHLWSVAAFGINVVAVSLPGRFDGDSEAVANMAFPWDTLFAPAGYAFAIWAVIYIGEMFGIVHQLLNRDKLGYGVTAGAPGWISANISQSLWCIAFRPWALRELWLSSALLGTTAVCLFVSLHREQSQYNGKVAEPLRWLRIFPRSLHLGWVSAATLVNINAWVGYDTRFDSQAALVSTIISVTVATCLGLCYGVLTKMPLAGIAVAWALVAVSLGEPVGQSAEIVGPMVLGALAISEGVCGMVCGVVCATRAILLRFACS